MLRIVSLLLLVSAGCYGVYYLVNEKPEMVSKVAGFIDTGSFNTLEVRYAAAQIMESQKKALLSSQRHKYLEPELKFYPYLLLEVKYNISEDKTREGLMLWDLTDGEMVIETKHWDKTHGFGDCLSASIDRQEFKVLGLLAKRGGTLDREALSKTLRVENEVLDSWIDSLRRKKLIVQTGNRYRLHLQNPKLTTSPETRIEERLVTKAYKGASRLPKRFSVNQIEKITRSAFGADFTIRKMVDVYLPVHSISVQNPDGSVHMSHYNALTGHELPPSYLLE